MNLEAVARDVRRRLKEHADPARAEGERRYFKETIRNYGVTVPKSRAIAKDVFAAHKAELDETGWLALTERLLAAGWFEEGTVGLALIEHARPAPSDALFTAYARWLERYVGNWAHCDDLCGSLIGPLLLARPRLVRRLRPWTRSRNRWLRRGAAVSLTMPARRGRFLEEALAIAEALLADDDDLVQKGCGWLLREAAKAHPTEVALFLERHAARMARTAFRYAIEKFPAAERKRLMAL